MTGMPASTAVLTAPLIASGSGAETASPSTFSVTAASIIWACAWASLLDSVYLSVTPAALAPSSAPFLATAQNEPPSPWVTIAIVRSPPWVRSTESPSFALSPLLSSPPLFSFVPHAAPKTASTSTSASANSVLPLMRFIT